MSRATPKHGDISLWDLHCNADRVGLFINWTPEPTTGCYLWTGRHLNGGHGIVSMVSRSVLVHRAVYRLLHEDIGQDLDVHHCCEQPACINPRHLIALTQEQHRNVHTGRGRAWVQYYGAPTRGYVEELDVFDAGFIGVPYRPVVFDLEIGGRSGPTASRPAQVTPPLRAGRLLSAAPTHATRGAR